MNTESSIDPKFTEDIKQMGINSIAELLLHIPTKYKDYRNPVSRLSKALEVDGSTYLCLKLTSKPIITHEPRKPSSVKLQFTDAIDYASAIVFGNTAPWEALNTGDIVYLTGNVTERDYNGNTYINIKSPCLIKEYEQGQIVPQYRGQVGDKRSKDKVEITSERIGKNIIHALREGRKEVTELIIERAGVSEKQLLDDLQLPFNSIVEILDALHRPRTAYELSMAIKSTRLINGYKTLCEAAEECKVEYISESVINIDTNQLKEVVKSLDFDLTGDQRNAIWQIAQDLSSNIPMNRLLSGDVGCGKTLTYGIPAICANLSHQKRESKDKHPCVVILTPNTLLSNQIEKEIREIAPAMGAVTRLVTSDTDNSNGITEPTILVGTTAILNFVKAHKDSISVELLIIDEQQKLGQEQRNRLIERYTNVLQATATAVPRTTANVMFGSVDISIIEECPVKKHIQTAVCGTEHKRSVMAAVKETIENGSQVAILYPTRTQLDSYAEIKLPSTAIEEVTTFLKSHKVSVQSVSSAFNYQSRCKKDIGCTDDMSIAYVKFKSAREEEFLTAIVELEKIGCEYIGEADGHIQDVEQAFEKWNSIYPDQVVMIHGGLRPKDKIAAIERAKMGIKHCKVIITSSVIEIGLTLPDLKMMIVISADRYGAGTLHQFRGRLARKGGSGKFILMCNKFLADMNPDTINRLNIVKKNTRGSKIAEEDMEHRGFGSLSKSSTVQKGNLDGVFKGVKVRPDDIKELLSTNLGKKLSTPRRNL